MIDDEEGNIRRQKARDRYANMPPDKKAELNAKRRENRRKKADNKAVGSLHVLLHIFLKVVCQILYDIYKL